MASSLTRALPHRQLLVVAGQSNALGATSYAVDPTTGINYFSRRYRNGADSKSDITWPGWWELAPPATTTGLVPIDTPQILTFVSPKTRIFGPEVGLARQIWTDTKQAVTIDKVVYSNASLAVDWNPGSTGGIFDDMTSIVEHTMGTDAARGQLDTIGAFYWYQGESDAADPMLYPAYQENLANFISSVRSRVPISGSAPIVLVKESMAELIATEQSAGSCASPNCAELTAGDSAVRAADDWAAAVDSHVLTADSLGLPRTTSNSGVHLANTGELLLGERLAGATEHLFP
jgi:hypothetical protein